MSRRTPFTPSKSGIRPQGGTTNSTPSMSPTRPSGTVPSTGTTSPPAIIDHVDEIAVGLSGPDDTGNRRAMLQLINRLHDIGVQTDIDLPMIAVIGNQSAGKSSLIEAISGITLPRSSGTCTRCPIECKLSCSDSPWKCVVKLHFGTDPKGVPIPVNIVPFGDSITSKSKVEDRIRRAQRAILNPSTNSEKYLQDNVADENEISFSKNYVSLEISGSELADLSFVDLPGLIASVGTRGDERDIELVKSLVTSYIEKPSCIILLTVACETDFENQGAHHLAKKYDPEGRRTVGVLTKPDRIPKGEESQWLKILCNETETLVNNWYCVKRPSSEEVADGITWEDARQRENDWFSSMQPWCTLDSQYQRFLRTSYLMERLSLILSDLIKKRLPKIRDELAMAILDTEKKLDALPKAPSDDPTSEVFHIIGCFVRDLESRVKGTCEADGLLQTIRPHQISFKYAIRQTAPNFVPWDSKTKRELPRPAFLSNEEVYLNAVVQEIYIDEVFREAEKMRTRQLPGNYPFEVQLKYMKEITGKWRTPAMTFFDNVYEIVKADVTKLVKAHFEHMGNGNATHAVLMIINDHLDAAAERTKLGIEWLLNLESNPTTFNTHYFADYQYKFITYYKACRDSGGLMARLEDEDEETIDDALSSLGAIGLQAQKTDLPKLLPPDPMEPALEIMASVRAYFQVAYKRFADMVPMAIDQDMVLGLKIGLDKALHKGLQITGPDGYKRCKVMLEESIYIMSARQASRDKLQRLRTATAELRQLM